MVFVEMAGIICSPEGIPGAVPGGGLYLVSRGGKAYKLVSGNIALHIATDTLWRQSRPSFEPYLGKRDIVVTGELDTESSAIFSAVAKEMVSQANHS